MASHGIPEDLVVEILKRLPVKSLLRFKATSKRWYALISCPNFIKSHLAYSPDRVLILNHSRNRQFFLFPDCDDESRVVNLNTDGVESVNLSTDGVEPVIDFNQLWGYASCDGIVCLFGGYQYDVTPPIIHITLWNPACKKFKSLPTSSYSALIDKIGARAIKTKSDDYKVVVIINLWREGEGQPYMNYAQVYSLKTNSWRVIDAPNAPFLYSTTTSTYTQGVFYWIASVDHIVSFDLAEEVFRVAPPPPPKLPSESSPEIELASSNESVVVMYCSNYTPIEVWATKDLFTLGGDCWTLEYILEPPVAVPPVYDLCLYPLSSWKNCLLFIQGYIPGPGYFSKSYVREFCLYNPGTGEIRNLQFPGIIVTPETYRSPTWRRKREIQATFWCLLIRLLL